MGAVIEARGLSRNYGNVEAVRDVSFEIGTGEIVGLLGPNGAGKTTIMKILTCYLFPSQGTALVAGHDVVEDPVSVKSSIGYLPENTPLYGDLTVSDYLRFIAGARGLTAARRAERLQRVTRECRIREVMHKGIDELSKGFRQRVGLAQALLHDPPLLILDEPTAGLDPHQIVEMRDLIKGLGSDKTVILSSHILQEVEATCQRVLILNEGRIVAQGTREEMERTLKGEELLDVTLRAQDSAAIDQRSLAGIRGVKRVISLTPVGKTDVVVRLSLAPDARAEAGIFDWAVSSGLKIISMVPRRLSLEDIFLSLTEKEPQT